MPNLPQRANARPERVRGTTKERGYGNDWKRCRAAYVREHPLCEDCLKAGRATLSEDVDHIIAIEDGGARLDWSNLRALCRPCHMRKTFGR